MSRLARAGVGAAAAAALLLGPAAPPVAAGSIGPAVGQQWGSVVSAPWRAATVSALAVRSRPSSAGSLVGYVRLGNKIQDYGRSGGWTKIAPNRWVVTSQTRATTAPRFTTAAIVGSYNGILVEAGTYALWHKARSTVLLVRNGTVVRAMPTTDNDWTTVPGNYSVKAAPRTGSSGQYLLPYFTLIGTIPGRTGIGFHSLPVTRSGQYIQPISTVGLPGYESHGCLRLRPADARALASFVRVGMPVKVR
jgi:hypothetical protein